MENTIAIALILVTMIASCRLAKITQAGAFTGAVIALSIWMGAGWCGLAGLFSFFFAGTQVSGLGMKKKIALNLGQENKGVRSHINALANGGIAGICGLLAWSMPALDSLFVVMVMSSLATAASDTFSSELGNVHGTKYVDILSFQRGKRGDDGVLSPEGTMAGLLGSFLIAIIYFFFKPGYMAAIIFTAGIIGNLFDSLIGATLQRRGIINNHQVNFFATMAGALIGGVMFYLT